MKNINTNKLIINIKGVIPNIRLLDNTINTGFLNLIEKKDMKIIVTKNAMTGPLPPGYSIPLSRTINRNT
jgi:hypothetical protein